MIYTIGYAGTKIDEFVQILKNSKISFLIDVRSNPKSQYFKKFNDYILSKKLSDVDIQYKNFKLEFGARQNNLSFYSDNIFNFEKFAES